MVQSDNTNMLYHINQLGGIELVKLLWVTKQLLTWAAPRLASLRVVYIPGRQNLAEEALSGGMEAPPRGSAMYLGSFWKGKSRPLYLKGATHCPQWFSLADNSSSLGQNTLAHD